MALSSQTGRSSSRNSFMSSRRRPRRGRLFFLLTAVVILGAGGWWYFDAEEKPATSTPLVAATNERPIQPPPTVTFEPPPSVTAPPSETKPEEQPEPSSIPDPAVIVPATFTPPTSNAIAHAVELASTDPVEARRVLTNAWQTNELSAADRDTAASLATSLSELVLFDQRIFDGDPFTKRYVVQSGDALERIARREGVETEWTFIANLNNLPNPNAIRIGQTLKLPVGTFHAEVFKSDYRLDLFQQVGNERVLVGSYKVGLGEFGSTPVGLFRVRPASKLIDPEWIDPRTRQKFAGNDPLNPIGKRWIGIQGLEESNRGLRGFGIHGTIDPESIGKQESMGCIRMLPDDVALIYHVLSEPNSTIEVHAPRQIVTQPDSGE